MWFRFFYVGVAAFLFISLSGCGYRMVGGGSLPGGVETVAIPMMVNRTSETGLETVVTNALIVQMNRRRKGSAVGTETAQAELRGTIDTMGRETVTRKSAHTALERRVYMVISLVLTRNDGEQLWKGDGLRAEQTYVVLDDDPIATNTNRRQALDLLAERLAETVVHRLTDDF